MRTGEAKRRIGKLRVWALLLLAASFLLCAYSEEDPKVFDDAGLFDETEEALLQQEIVKTAGKLSLDVVVVTSDDVRGKSSGRYADDYYDDHGFGYEKESGSGILLLIDMDNRMVEVSTSGLAMEMYTDLDVDNMLDYVIMPHMRDGDYYEAARAFVNCLVEYGANDEVAKNGYYDAAADAFVEYTPEEIKANERSEALKKSFSAVNIATRLALGMMIGAIGTGIMVIRVRSQKAPSGRVYMKPGSERLRDRRDFKVNTTVTTRRIERNSGGGGGGRSSSGSGHTTSRTSSSGRSHGGGGRSF